MLAGKQNRAPGRLLDLEFEPHVGYFPGRDVNDPAGTKICFAQGATGCPPACGQLYVGCQSGFIRQKQNMR